MIGCMGRVFVFFQSLVLVFDFKWFSQYKDTQRLKRVMHCFRDAQWKRQSRVVQHIAKSLGHLLSWGGGCSCCEAEFVVGRGRETQCMKKGRRLKDAWKYATQCMAELLEEGNRWDQSDFDDDWALLREAQGCIRCCYHLSTK